MVVVCVTLSQLHHALDVLCVKSRSWALESPLGVKVLDPEREDGLVQIGYARVFLSPWR